MRLDAYLAGELAPEYSRSQILKAIKAGLVMMNQRPARASEPIRAGDRIEFRVPAPAAPIVAAAPAPGVDVIYQDADIIFVNKPPGMVVHPSAGHPHSTLVDALVARFPDLATVVEMDGSWRAGIVHRLDKDTSGVMVVARNSFARAALSAQFKQRSVEKIYLALALGHPGRERMTIDQPIGRHQTERKRMSVRSRTGREAVSEVRVIQRCQLSLAGGARIAVGLLAVRPRTGRTHQIRVHLSAAGHPCLGDPLYGRQEREQLPIRRQALHAFYLAVTHPRSGSRIGIVAPIAPDLEELLASCGLDSDRIRAAVLGDSQGVGNRAGNAKIM
ncbi:MAG TPA: RluA family pseudouridine synthase [Candidatus Binataceae bacterium]|nr:RluA family pseudouridine synthase [Candidatus Binataceae bacterium]